KRGTRAEAMLQGVSLDDPPSWDLAISALAEDFQPISDMRASADYRMNVAQGLLGKALIEIAGADGGTTRILNPLPEPA
ncbi:MAG: xanthine dehydrogenase small subunit, partial [Aestuariivirga sp.]